MAERAPRTPAVINVLVLIGFGWLAIVVELAPLGRAAASASPDLLFCVAAFLVLRRPSSTPVVVVILLGMLRDVLSGGPTGLGALTLVFATEALRLARPALVRRALPVELIVVAAVAAAMSALQVAALVVTLTPLPVLSIIGLRLIETMVAYVAVYVVFRYILRVQADGVENTRLIGRGER